MATATVTPPQMVFGTRSRSAPSIAARSQTQPTPVTDATKPESEKLPGTAASACAL